MMPRAVLSFSLSIYLSHDATHTNVLRTVAVLPALPASFALEPVFILQPVGQLYWLWKNSRAGCRCPAPQLKVEHGSSPS